MTFTPTIVTPSWMFQTTVASPTVEYVGGFYDFAAVPNDFSGGPTFGSANAATAAHFFIGTGPSPAGSDTVIRVTGTSINDSGTRTAGDTQDITVPDGQAVDSYFETPKKWLGVVTITVFSGSAISCNYGWSKYHDVNNQDFTVIGLECIWISDANDSASAASDIRFLKHSSTGWTYNASGPVVRPTAIATRTGDFATDDLNVTGEQGAWKRANLALVINGADSQGFMFEIESEDAGVGNLSFRNMTVQVSLRV